jgi:hypothetical protein
VQCSVSHSSNNSAWSGNCNIDVNECASSPCQHGATCSESTSQLSVTYHAYRCSCAAGYANGWCQYGSIHQYSVACAVTESSANLALSGNCDVDVDECSSAPCHNGATCSDSSTSSLVRLHAFRCTCLAGFANGWCGYRYLREVYSLCQVDSGRCDVGTFPCFTVFVALSLLYIFGFVF